MFFRGTIKAAKNALSRTAPAARTQVRHFSTDYADNYDSDLSNDPNSISWRKTDSSREDNAASYISDTITHNSRLFGGSTSGGTKSVSIATVINDDKLRRKF